jgi:hypothetical protein
MNTAQVLCGLCLCWFFVTVHGAGNDRVYVQEVIYESWFERLGDSFVGFIIGIILTLLSPCLFAWNERRAVRRAAALKEGAAAVQSVDSEEADPTNEGQLVHVVARICSVAEPLHDEDFDVYAGEGTRLERKVEMYQWKENVSSKRSKDIVGGGTTTVNNYTYSTDWYSEHHDSSHFKNPAGHVNPPAIAFRSYTLSSKQVKLGGFNLSTSLISKINNWEPLALTDEHQELLNSPKRPAAKMHCHKNTYYIGSDPLNPQVGDLRVSFKICPPTVASVIAQQQGDNLVPYITSSGEELELLQMGNVSPAAMFKSAQDSDRVMTILLRVLFFVLQWVGIGLLLNPLTVAVDILPIVGLIINQGIGLVSFLAAVVISSVVIAVTWFGYRIWFFFFGSSSSSTPRRKPKVK